MHGKRVQLCGTITNSFIIMHSGDCLCIEQSAWRINWLSLCKPALWSCWLGGWCMSRWGRKLGLAENESPAPMHGRSGAIQCHRPPACRSLSLSVAVRLCLWLEASRRATETQRRHKAVHCFDQYPWGAILWPAAERGKGRERERRGTTGCYIVAVVAH